MDFKMNGKMIIFEKLNPTLAFTKMFIFPFIFPSHFCWSTTTSPPTIATLAPLPQLWMVANNPILVEKIPVLTTTLIDQWWPTPQQQLQQLPPLLASTNRVSRHDYNEQPPQDRDQGMGRMGLKMCHHISRPRYVSFFLSIYRHGWLQWMSTTANVHHTPGQGWVKPPHPLCKFFFCSNFCSKY